MESYVVLSIRCPTHAKTCEQILTSLADQNIDDAMRFWSTMGSDTAEQLDKLVSDYADYIGAIDDISVAPSELEVHYVCGSGGEDFLAGLIQLFGPYVTEISGTFDHDEEHDEGEQWNFSFKEGQVLLNGKKYQSSRGQFNNNDGGSDILSALFDAASEVFDTYSDKVLLICDLPDGEAPEWVRLEWIGLRIPILQECLVCHTGEAETVTGVLSGEEEEMEGGSPYILALDAFEILEKKSVAAYEWWKSYCPEFFSPGQCFIFDAPSWKIEDK